MSEVNQQVKARRRFATPWRANPNTLSRRAAGLDQSVSRGSVPKQSDTAQLMASKRMLSPEMFTSRSVNAQPVATRWTWAGLLCYLDDYGYGEDAAALVHAAVWPRDEMYTITDVEADLAKLTDADSLCRFTCCDKNQIHAVNWREWQTVPHPGKPRFCVCPDHSRDAHEIHLNASRERHELLSLKEISSDQRSLGTDVHDLNACLRPDLCHFHRSAVTA
jgi:hypothetical protein